jgi:hypothetical protein
MIVLLMMSAVGTVNALQNASSNTAISTAVWKQDIAATSVSGAGCFESNYPSTQWQAVTCGTTALAPMVNYVGGGYDFVTQAPSGKNIEDALGEVSSMSGLVDEVDNSYGTHYYSIQDNSQEYYDSAYNSNAGAWLWQQFVYQNDPGSSAGSVYIQYWLIGYYGDHLDTCPSSHSGMTPWQVYADNSCWANSSSNGSTTTATSTPLENPSGLASMSFYGEADQDNGGYDEAIMCTSTTCYTLSNSYSIFDLASWWTQSEWNVLGYADGSSAGFNHATSITVEQVLYNGVMNNLTPSCAGPNGSVSNTAEENNMTLGSTPTCSVQSSSSPYYTYFTET